MTQGLDLSGQAALVTGWIRTGFKLFGYMARRLWAEAEGMAAGSLAAA